MHPASPLHPAARDPEDLARELEYQATRSTGPGGQHRNRVATAVRVRHVPTGLTAMGTERRSQKDNRREALFRLRLKLALEHRPPPTDADLVAPGDYRPSAAWMRRLRGGRVRASPNHEDFPALLAEVLDRLEVDEDDLERTAAAFGVSKSQLIKFLAVEPRALHALNERRRERGQRPLKA